MISIRDQPSQSDSDQIATLLADLTNIEREELGGFYDQRFYPVAQAVAANASRTGDSGWMALFLDMRVAAAGFAVEDFSILDKELREQQPEAYTTGKRGRGLESAAAAGDSSDLPWDITVSAAGCRMVFVGTEHLVKTNGRVMVSGTLRVMDEDGVEIDRFWVRTGGGSPPYSITNGPLPPGRYKVHYYRSNREDKPTMVVEGKSYSFNLTEVDDTDVFGRSLFRIHPDGGPIGTLGCIGIVGGATIQDRFEELAAKMLSTGSYKLAASYRFGVTESGALEAAAADMSGEIEGVATANEPGIDAFHVIERTEAFETLRESEGSLKSAEGAATESAIQLVTDAKNLIIRYESGGRSYYNSRLSRPTWPKYSSGLTIGFGYDLGYKTITEFSTAWRHLLPPDHFTALSQAIGLNAKNPNRAGKVARLQQFEVALSDIVIPWDMAEGVFAAHTVPKYVGLTKHTVPNFVSTPPLCQGAIVSLVFNRGASFRRKGDRYREMRAIRSAFENSELERVPAQLRSMRRLWPNSPPPYGLQQRREDEASLFERGLG